MKLVLIISALVLSSCVAKSPKSQDKRIPANTPQRFDQFFLKSTCTSNVKTPKVIRGSRIYEASGVGEGYPIFCKEEGNQVVCDFDKNEHPPTCLQTLNFTYDKTTKQSQLREVWAGCQVDRSRDGTFDYKCNTEPLTASSRASWDLNKAVCLGNANDVSYYMRFRGVEIDFIDPMSGKSTLGCAFENNSAQILRMLLGNGSIEYDPYIQDRLGKYPVTYAKSPDHLMALKEFVPDYDMNRLDKNGFAFLNQCKDMQVCNKALELWPNSKVAEVKAPVSCLRVNGTVITDYDYNCKLYSYLEIPEVINGVKILSIGDNALNLEGFNKVILPESLQKIGNYALSGNFLSEIKIPSGVKIIGKSAFSSNRLTSVNIPAVLTIISEFAFYDNKLTEVKIPHGVKTIEARAFWRNQITKLEISDTVETIGQMAFNDNQITELEIPESVKLIDSLAFRGNKLIKVIIPKDTVVHDVAFERNVEIIRK